MDRHARLQQLYENVLQPRLVEIDRYRQRVRNLAIGGVLCALVGVGSCSMACDTPAALAQSPWARQAPFGFALLSIAAFLLAIMRFLVPGVMGHTNYRARFKKEVLADVVRAVRPRAQYFADRHLTRQVYDESGLFFNRLDSFGGDDLLRDFAGETPFDASELNTSYKTGSSDQSERVHTVFHGLFFQLDFDRDVPGRTLLFPGAKGKPPTGSPPLTHVATGDPAFDDAFSVWSNAPEGVPGLLSDDMRRGLLAAADTVGAPLSVAFSGGRVYGGIEYGRNLFEPTFFTSIDLPTLERMVGQLEAVDEVVRALGLEHRRRRPPDPAFHTSAVKVSKMEAITAAGDVTGLEQMASREARAEEAQASAPVLPPGHRTIAQIEELGGELRLSYAGSFGLVFCTAMAAALSVLLPLLLANWGAPELARRVVPLLQDRHPAVDAFLAGMAANPTAFLLVGAFLWWYFTWMVRYRPATVTVGSQGVAIRRVFRPWSFTLPLEAIRRLEATGHTAYLIRRDRSFLGSFVPASPTLRNDLEARWLVAQLRRGLTQAGWVEPRG
jgi:hypothetical protein